MYYHGGFNARNIHEFNNNYNGINTGDNTGGFYFTNDYAQANSYAVESFKGKIEDKYYMLSKDKIKQIAKHIGAYSSNMVDVIDRFVEIYTNNKSTKDTIEVSLNIKNPIIIDCDYKVMDHELKSGICAFIRKLNYINSYADDSYIDHGYEFFYNNKHFFFSKELLQEIEENYSQEDYEEPDPDLIPNCLILKNVNDNISEYMDYSFDVTIMFNPYDIEIINKGIN
ncbi:MAG: hypothetical protein U9O94_05940 [Nanoarchaeota archaeon]|nr:hypothetical protein [Nanoarchaeota archaeon]